MKKLILILLILFHVSVYAQNNQTKDDSFAAEIDSEIQQAEKKKEQTTNVQDSSNRLDMAAVVDTVGFWQGNKESTALNRFFVREAALGIFNDIDHLARGTLRLNLETEDGIQYEPGVEEAYFEFLTLPYGLYAKVGKFLVDAGRLNTFHRHAWNFDSSPLVYETFFGEGINEAGAEVSILMPWSFYQELRIGIFNGDSIGSDAPSLKKSMPMMTARLKHFFPLGQRWGTQFGFSFIRYAPDQDKRNYNLYYGADAMLKWKKNSLRSFSVTSEVWMKQAYRNHVLKKKNIGGYLALNWQFLQTWTVSVRQDVVNSFRLKTADYETGLWLKWQPSGFAYYRIGATRHKPYQSLEEYTIRTQADFVVGYHPAHKY
ncbi:MAG: hypothetical protein D6767_00095 [Candidatus Hydrogenedentota bacterium]|nr:MAG: hypothetical protein D6767_00095 [Candidatus Hydrogenedentota bacterium]